MPDYTPIDVTSGSLRRPCIAWGPEKCQRWPPRGRRRQNRRIAYASAKEVDTHLRLLAVTGAVSETAAETTIDGFDYVRAMTWRLLYPAA